MNEETKILQIFDYIEEEFSRFKKKDKAGLIYRFFREKTVNAKLAVTDRGFRTIGMINKKQRMVTGPAFVIFSQDDYFYGHFVESKRSGPGYHRFPNGFIFCGDYLNDEKVAGVVFDPRTNTEVYRGGWRDDLYSGYGTLRNPTNGAHYEGEFRYGLFNGHGKQVWPEGDSFEGTFLNGRPHGRGILTLPGKGDYVGHFHHGSFHGRGSMRWKSGEVFKGQFENGAISGEGEMMYSNGQVVGSGVWDNRGSRRVVYGLNN